MLSRFKNFCKNKQSDLFIITTIILVALISFGIGRLSAPESEPVLIKNLEPASSSSLLSEEDGQASIKDIGGQVYPPTTEQSDVGRVVGSKNSDKYHLPDCPGAKQISEQNKIWFNSIEEAKKAGYKPASNCPGLN